jgi:HK97 gp10 family phage protein
MQFDVDVKGLAEIERKLKLLPQRLGQNAMRRALRKGANVIRDAARINARAIDNPETREQIFKNVSVSGGGSRMERRMGGPMMRVGIRGGARHRKGDGLDGLPGGNTTHWRWVEFGTSQVPARPFMRQAAASSASAAYQAVVAAAPAEIDKELRKLGIT